MTIEKSLWERIGSIDSSSAADRERFAAKYDRLTQRRKPAVGGWRVSHFDLSADLRQQDAPAPGRNADRAA